MTLPACPHVPDLRRLRWLPGSMVPDTTRCSCPLCDMPFGRVHARCTAVMVDGRRCRLPVHVTGLCRIHWQVARWAA